MWAPKVRGEDRKNQLYSIPEVIVVLQSTGEGEMSQTDQIPAIMELPFKQGLRQRASLCPVTSGAKLVTQSPVEKDSTWTGHLFSVSHCQPEPPTVTSPDPILEGHEDENS